MKKTLAIFSLLVTLSLAVSAVVIGVRLQEDVAPESSFACIDCGGDCCPDGW